MEIGEEFHNPRTGTRVTRTLAVGETLQLEPDTGHANPYNESSEPLTFLHSVEPSNSFVRAYVATWVEKLEAGELNEQDEFTALQLFPVLAATKARSFVVGPPIAAQKLVIPVVAALGRMRGNRPVLPQPEVAVSSSVSPSPSPSPSSS
jgi:hypothetical protein